MAAEWRILLRRTTFSRTTVSHWWWQRFACTWQLEPAILYHLFFSSPSPPSPFIRVMRERQRRQVTLKGRRKENFTALHARGCANRTWNWIHSHWMRAKTCALRGGIRTSGGPTMSPLSSSRHFRVVKSRWSGKNVLGQSLVPLGAPHHCMRIRWTSVQRSLIRIPAGLPTKSIRARLTRQPMGEWKSTHANLCMCAVRLLYAIVCSKFGRALASTYRAFRMRPRHG